jgi:hypothetical protein
MTALAGFKSYAVDGAGNVQASTQIQVYERDGTTTATIYSDDDGTSLANPFNAGSDGDFEFFAPNARYVVKVGTGASASTFGVELAAGGDLTVFFDTRANAVTDIALVPTGAFIEVPPFKWQKVSSSSAIGDMANTNPVAPYHLVHWGASGEASGSAEDAPPATATVDVTTRLQEAFDYALSNGVKVSGDPYRVYGVTAPLLFCARSGLSDVRQGAEISDMVLSVMGGTWDTSGVQTDANPSNWTWGDNVLQVGKGASYGGSKNRVVTTNILVDCNYTAAVGIWYRGASQRIHSGCGAVRPLEACVRIGEPGVQGSNCTDSKFANMRTLEFYTSSDPSNGFNDLTLRQATGIYYSTSDAVVEVTTSSGCLYNLVLADFANAQFVAGKYWSGGTRTDANSKTVLIGPDADKYQFAGTRFDDGQVLVKSFNGQFDGCLFHQFTAGAELNLEAQSANETASEFVFTGNKLSGSSPVTQTTAGSGSWDQFAGKVVANVNSNGGLVTIDEVGTLVDDNSYFGDGAGVLSIPNALTLNDFTNSNSTIRANGSLTLSADYDNNSGNTDSRIHFKADDTLWHTIRQNGQLEFMVGQATGGGAVALLRNNGDDFQIQPTDAAGGYASASIFFYDQSEDTWTFQTPVSADSFEVSGAQVVGAQGGAVADLTVTATTGTLPTPDGSVTIADAAAPTNAELLEAFVELNAKYNTLKDRIEAHGLIAT